MIGGVDDSCDPTPSERIMTLPQGCTEKEKNSVTIDVGKCNKKKCIARSLKNINNCKDNFCCHPIATKKIKIDCKRYSFDMTRVTRCGCGDCFPRQSVIKGVARGGPDNIPFKYGYIYQGDKYLARTRRKGEFSFKVPGDLSRLVVTFKDKRGYNNFQDLTKVIPLVPGRETYVEARMRLRPEPITVNAKEGFEIPLGIAGSMKRENYGVTGDSSESDKQPAPAIALALPPQSLISEDGTVYDGPAKVEVSFVDPRNATEVAEADGDFTTVDEDGEQQLLETFGVVKMDFRDDSGKRLQPNKDIDVLLDLDEYNITEKEAEDIKLWYMDEKTGRWRIMDPGLKQHETRRSKRSGRMFYFGKIDAKQSFTRINLDKWAGTCLFKVNFADVDIDNLNNPHLTVFTTKNNLNNYRSHAVTPNVATCIRTLCTGHNAIIRASANGEYLLPKESGIDDAVKNKHAIQYYRSEEVTDRHSNRITMKELTQPLNTQASPFYSDIPSCENTPEEYSFSFEMPKRNEIPDDLLENFDDGWYPDPEEASVCYVKIAVDNIDSCPNKTASFAVESILGDGDDDQTWAGNVIIRLNESEPTACAEYKCPQRGDRENFIRVNVIAITAGGFTTYRSETQEFRDEMETTVLIDVFSFNPKFHLKKISIGIIQSDELILDEKNEERDDCMKTEVNAGIRFMCNDYGLWP